MNIGIEGWPCEHDMVYTRSEVLEKLVRDARMVRDAHMVRRPPRLASKAAAQRVARPAAVSSVGVSGVKRKAASGDDTDNKKACRPMAKRGVKRKAASGDDANNKKACPQHVLLLG